MRLSESQWYALRRLHSLTGVFPIGVFLLEHFFTNSHAVQSGRAFDEAAAFLAGLPYVVLIEALGIWLPILFHMVLGIVIATQGDANVGRYAHARNWQYFLQRLSGVILVFFIAYHMWSTRLNAEAMAAPSLFEWMSGHLAHPGVFAFYALGVVSACWHFGNGLFGFAIHWGITTGRSAQRWAARLGIAVFVVLSLVGLNALLAFRGAAVKLFEKGHESAAVAATPIPGGHE
jgi:succinate dehydrogenase / fumarate reductase cytochrome b subunit